MKRGYEPKTTRAKLAHLVEECGEVTAAVGKTLRFGLDKCNPEIHDGETNRAWVLREIKDLKAAIRRVEDDLT